MSFIPTSPHSVLPSGNATACSDAKRLLVLEGGCPLFVPDQIVTWINQYCADIKLFKSGVTIAVMYAGATVAQLSSMGQITHENRAVQRVVRDNLAGHFGSIVILGAYSPPADEYHEEVIVLDEHNRNTLYLLSNEFVDGMLHDQRFQIHNDDCLRKAWQEALRIIFGIAVSICDTQRAHYKLPCGTTMFANKIHPQPEVKTIAELRQIWADAERIIGPMPTRDPQAHVADPKQQHERASAFWTR